METILQAAPTTEPVFYNISGKWYKGNLGGFTDVAAIPFCSYLESRYPEIRQEILQEFMDHEADFKTNFTPYNYSEEGWKTINLYSYYYRNSDNVKKFPVLESIARAHPDVCTIQVSTLKPNTRLKAHFGDSSGILRIHLGILIPGTYPEIGFRVGSEEVCWEEGRTLAFHPVVRHYAWNYSDKTRIILSLDIIRPEHFKRRRQVAALTLAAIATRFVAIRIPSLKNMPMPFVRFWHRCFGAFFRFMLYIQDTLKVDVFRLIERIRK